MKVPLAPNIFFDKMHPFRFPKLAAFFSKCRLFISVDRLQVIFNFGKKWRSERYTHVARDSEDTRHSVLLACRVCSKYHATRAWRPPSHFLPKLQITRSLKLKKLEQKKELITCCFVTESEGARVYSWFDVTNTLPCKSVCMCQIMISTRS